MENFVNFWKLNHSWVVQKYRARSEDIFKVVVFFKISRTISLNLYEIYFISNNRKSNSLCLSPSLSLWIKYTFFLQFAFLILLKILQSSRDSCHISRSTVQIVKDCPKSEEQWKQAAVRKNCEAYAGQCSKPERLEYHCVINPFMNQTLEVCAYAQNIVLGKFSFTIDLIQIETI